MQQRAADTGAATIWLDVHALDIGFVAIFLSDLPPEPGHADDGAFGIGAEHDVIG